MLPFRVDPERDSICDVARRWAEIQPDAPAFITEEGPPVTYNGLVNYIDDLGARLAALGFRQGSRTALLHSGGTQCALLLMAIMDRGAVVPIDPAISREEFEFRINAMGIDGLVLEAGLNSCARDNAVQSRIPFCEILTTDLTNDADLSPYVSGQEFRWDRPVENATDTELVLMTSGTTSLGKVVPVSRSRVLGWIAARAEFLSMSSEDRCIVFRPLYYAGGIINILFTIYSGGSVAVLDRFDIRKFFNYLESIEPTWFEASPVIQKRICALAKERPRGIVKSTLRFIRVSSGTLDVSTANDLERIFGVPLVENYSSTEAGSVTSNPANLEARKRGTVGVPVGCSVKIVDEAGKTVAHHVRGEILVRGPSVFEGYENDAETNAEAFVDGWFRTGDEGFLDEDGYLTLTGRIKEMINRGGEKVLPAEVDAEALKHPEVAEAATFPIPHPTLGEEVAMAVVREGGSALEERELTEFLRARLAGFKLPRKVVFVDRIPKSDAGKVQRYTLAEALGVGLEPAASELGTPPRRATPMEHRLRGIWQRILNREEIGLSDNFFLLGGDSLQAVELFHQIEKEMKCRLPVAAVFEADTISEMAKLIEDDKPHGCIVPINPRGSRPPFFCVHGASGQVIGFYHLSRHLGADQPFYGIQSIGWDRSAPPFTKSRDIAAHYVVEMRKIQPHGPYYLGGFSFGGRIAVYIANMLKHAGEEVALLAILDSSIGIGKHYVSYRQWLERIDAPSGPNRVGLAIDYGLFRMRKGWDAVYDRFRRFGVFAARELYRRLGWAVPVSMCRPDRLNALIRIEHQSMPVYEGDAVYFRTMIPKRSMAHPDTKDAWARVIKGKLETISIPGTHEEVIQEPNVRLVAEALKPRFANTAAPSSLQRKNACS